MSEFIPPAGAIVSEDKQLDFIPPTDAIVSDGEEIETEEVELVGEVVPIKEEEIIETEIKEAPTLQDAEIDSIKRNFDQGEFLTDQIPAYENYKQTGELDISLLPEKKPEKNLLVDYGSRFINTMLSLAKGKEDLNTGFKMLATKYAMNIFDPEATKEEKQAVIDKIKATGDVKTLGLTKGMEALNKNLRVYETESMVDDFNNGNYGQFTERVVGQAIGAVPSILLTSTGIGGILNLGASSAGSKFNELVEENPEESLERISFNALGTGAVEAAFELGTRGILKRAGILGNSGNTQAAKDLINSYTSKFAKYLDIPLEGGLEAGTVLFQDLLDALPRSLGGLGKADKYESMEEYFKATGTTKKMWEAFNVGTVMGGGVNIVGALKDGSQVKKDRAVQVLMPDSDKKIINDAAFEINNLNKQIKEVDKKEDVDILEAQISNKENIIINTKKKVSEELNMMNPDELKAYATNQDEIIKERKRAVSKSSFVKDFSAQKLANLELENQALIRESVNRRLSEVTETVDVKDIGRTVSSYNDTQSFQKAFKNTKDGKNSSMNVEGADGFIDSSGDIFINRVVAEKVKNVNVPAHELFHGIIKNNIQEPGQLNKLVNEFKSVLPKDQLEKVQKRIDDNYRYERDKEGNIIKELKKEEYNEEYFTAFADLIGNRQIKFNENIFTNIGEFLTPIFTKKGYGNIKFKTGKDVYDFIKTYQKEISKGELSKETIEAAKKVTEEDIKTKFSKSEVTELAKQYKKDPNKTDVKELIKQYDNVALKALGYDISKGTIAPEEAISFVNKEFDSILKRYDGSTEFSTWINSNIRPKRQAFYEEQIGKESETTSIDSEQARQVVDDSSETTDDRTEKEIRQSERKTKVAKRLKLEDKAIKEVASKIENIDLSKVNYKTLKNLANETIGEAFGISPKKILSNANLTKVEIANAQRYIKNNVDLLKALLPDGYNKDFKSTGVPKVLLDKFYNKRSVRSKTGAGLNVQNKKPNIGSVEFLEVFGFVEGKPTRDDRNISARIIALANQTGKAITNQTIREQLQKDGMPESALQDIKSGTPVGMFSKSKYKEFSIEEVDQLIEIAQASDINAAGVIANIPKGSITVTDKNRTAKVKQVLKDIIQFKLTLNTFESSMPASAGAVRFRVGKSPSLDTYLTENKIKSAEGDVWYKLTDGTYAKGFYKSTNIKGIKQFGPPVDNDGKPLTNLIPARGRLYYGKEDPNYIEALKAAKSNTKKDTLKPKKISVRERITKAFINKNKQSSIDNMKILEEVSLELNDAVNIGVEEINELGEKTGKIIKMPKETAALIIAQGYQATGGLIKISAPFSRVSRFFKYGPKESKQGDKSKRPFIEEHNPPASTIGATLIWAISNNKTKEIFPYIKRNYFQTQLSKASDYLLDEAMLDKRLPKGTSILDNSVIRLAIAGINLNNIIDPVTGKSEAEIFSVGVSSKYRNNPDVIAFQNSLIEDQIVNGLDPKAAKELLNEYLKLVPQKTKAGKFSKSVLSESKVLNLEGDLSMQELLGKAASIDEALSIARDINAPVKKIRVFDFDDTLATTKSDVLFTAPDGTEGKLNAEEFATKGKELLDEGYVFDFSEFNKVTKGKPGPLLDLAKKIQDARGTEDVFVLTARAPQAAIAIKEFLDSQGLNIPLKNITGLGKSTGEAKANWMIDKAAEGYNDFYFADDAYQNVKAVKDVMSVIDVKSKTQQAKFSLSEDLNSDFNKILENKSGIGAEKVYSSARAKTIGASKGKFKFFIPASAEDFVGLLYPTLAKGKLGDEQMAWYKERLLNPFARAAENLSRDRINLMNDFKALKKELEVPKDLRKKIVDNFTNEQAVRVYLWNKQGLDIPGLSKRDLKELSEAIDKNPKLKVFADQLQAINKSDGYPAPEETWLVGTITTDLINGLNTTKRTKYLEEWQTNSDIIFSKENLNKMEAIYGPKHREAMENILSRMKTGINRPAGGTRIGNQILDYINGSVGAIMFFNTRSAVLQTISAINFINVSGDNNILAAGKAFANQPQYWKDFVELINSPFLKDRRNGLKLNISESEIADAAATSKNKSKAALNYILQKGFLPTQFADSFAIASGGATFYRNKINSLIKDGMSESDAKEQAYKEFREISEESQQSSRPDKISQQQASGIGRIILAFANTPSQYARIIKKAAVDLKNGRGDWKNNISKIVYYGAMQNLIFNVLQQALFAVGFGDEEEDDDQMNKRYTKIGNGMVDSLLRGLGYGGAAVSVVKNLLLDVYERSNRKRPEYVDAPWKLLQFSPPIGSKISKLKAAGYMVDKYSDEMIDKGFDIDNPAYEAASKVITATTNVPLDRLFNKANNISAAMDEDSETWQSVAMLLGWSEWQIKPKVKKKKKKKKSSFGSTSFGSSSF